MIAIIGLLVGLIFPSLSDARRATRATKCLAQLSMLGKGLTTYTSENADILVPGRLPRVDNCHWQTDIAGGLKYRPTFLAMMGNNVGIPPFAEPQACRNTVDSEGQPGDRQNYATPLLYCPSTPTWKDERNGSYGYNYQFLGNSRLSNPADIHSFKNWPVPLTRLRSAAGTVAVADCLGTAASYPPSQRAAYTDNGSDPAQFGNEGFNLDPPWVDPDHGEMAGLEQRHRTAVDPRHAKRTNVLWVDGHAGAETMTALGYRLADDGTIALEGNNRWWTGNQANRPWIAESTNP